MNKKIFAAAAALVMLISLAGCAGSANTANTENGYFEGYYSGLAYEVKSGDGVITEQMYYLCSDPELSKVVGRKDVYYDEKTGEMNKYTVTIGTTKISQIVSYTNGDDASYYSEIIYDDNEKVSNGSWESNYINSDGVGVKELGHQEYYSGGNTVKSFHLEEYRDGELYQTTNREYDEAGNMTSETIE